MELTVVSRGSSHHVIHHLFHVLPALLSNPLVSFVELAVLMALFCTSCLNILLEMTAEVPHVCRSQIALLVPRVPSDAVPRNPDGILYLLRGTRVHDIPSLEIRSARSSRILYKIPTGAATLAVVHMHGVRGQLRYARTKIHQCMSACMSLCIYYPFMHMKASFISKFQSEPFRCSSPRRSFEN